MIWRMLGTVSAVPTVSEIVYPQRVKDKTGLFQIRMTGTITTLSIVLEGRASSEADWVKVKEFTQADLASNGAASVITIFPEMRVNLAAMTGTNPVANAFLAD